MLSDPSTSRGENLSSKAGGERSTELALPRCLENGAIKEGRAS